MKFSKKVLILGASSDIGLSIMNMYLNKNYKILAHYNNGNSKFSAFVKLNNIETIKFNFLTSNRNIEKFLSKSIFKTYGIFVNALGHIKELEFTKIKIKDLEDIFKVNLYPSILLTKFMGKIMYKKKWGRIVNLGSIGVKFGGGIKNFPYSLSKHALEFFPNETKQWAKNNVLINTIRVGATNTKLHLKLPSKNIDQRKKIIPMKRMAEPVEIAELVYFLGSDENTYISNQVIAASGGE
jgi:3-oxoacyl-[acyl-carrier protein] reductase|tara:strand:+ start:43 stop:759 length:717 start_codon:yes stop_codon:yes gene_type:complete